MKATKHNEGKPRWSLLLDEFTEELAGVLQVREYGAKKYNVDNWKGELPEPNFYRDAVFRHLMAKDKIDPDSGLPHIYHAICGLLMQAWHENRDGGRSTYTIEENKGPQKLEFADRVEYRLDCLLHREEGPAVIYKNGAVGFWIDGKEISKEEFDKRRKNNGQ